MRQKIVAGNWKMNTTLNEGIELAKQVVKHSQESDTNDVKIVLAPPFTHLTELARVIEGTEISVSAQNSASEPKGAFTGEVAASMIKSTGAEYTILGHSERRAYYHEDEPVLTKKLALTLENDLTPIFCIGEVLKEREANNHFKIVKHQLENGLFHLSGEDFLKIVIAYEPVWAIGTGKTATPKQAQEMHSFIRQEIAKKYNVEIANETSILYGGSCKPSNAKELFANPDVDGGLIGGASLKAEEFLGIIQSF